MILIISKSIEGASVISDMFYYMGIVAHSTTPNEALNEISEIYRAALIVQPERIYNERDYSDFLRSYAPKVPIFALGKSSFSETFDMTFKEGSSSSKIVSDMRSYMRDNGYEIVGDYILGDINASIEFPDVISSFGLLPFTQTEKMILRTLIRFYPKPIAAKEILKYSFRSARLPEASSIRTHISIINKKYRKLSGRNFIFMKNDKGYVLVSSSKDKTEPTV